MASVLDTARRSGDARHALEVARDSLNTESPGDAAISSDVRDLIKDTTARIDHPLDADGFLQQLIRLATLNAEVGYRHSEFRGRWPEDNHD